MCNILTLGKQLSVCRCETVAKAHEIIAWLPMMDAAIAKINVGQNRVPELTATKSTYNSVMLRTVVHNGMKDVLFKIYAYLELI